MSPRAPVNFLKSPLPIILFISILFFVFSTFLPSLSQALAATYYVDATNGNDGSTGLSESSAWKTIAKLNASTFNPGDQILFKRGEIWREQLTIPCSGMEGNLITFGAYGNGNLPIIDGADVMTNWIRYSADTFQKLAVVKEPKQVFMNGRRLVKGKKKDSLSDYEWTWENDTLYVRNDSGNPDEKGILMEASRRDYCVNSPRSYIIFKDLHFKSASLDNIAIATWVGLEITNIVIDSVISEHAYGRGILVEAAGHNIDDVRIANCSVFQNGGTGIHLGSMANYVSNCTVERNVVHHNAILVDTNFNAGIKAYGAGVSNLISQYNTIYSNGFGLGIESGMGIWYDTCGPGSVARYNIVYSNNKDGIYIEATSHSQIYYNLTYRNERAGIHLNRDIHNNEVYNNTCYGNDIGIMIDSYSPAPHSSEITGNIIRNNIAAGNTRRALIAKRGGENDGYYGNTNVYSHNCLGPERNGFIEWGENKLVSTYDEWEIITTNSIRTDPQLTDANNNNFQLIGNSPCIDSGLNVGLNQDILGTIVPQGNGVDIGAYESIKPPSPPKNLRFL